MTNYLKQNKEIEKILEIYTEAESYSKSDAIQQLINFVGEIVNQDNAKSMHIALINYLEQYRIDNDCCPYCNVPLITDSYEEGRTDCFETMYYKRCECGYDNLND